MSQINPIAKNAEGEYIALILWGETDAGEDDVAVFSRKLVRINHKYFFVDDAGHQIEARYDWVERLKAVPAEVQSTLLGCKYQIFLTVGNIANEESGQFEHIGLKWPT